MRGVNMARAEWRRNEVLPVSRPGRTIVHRLRVGGQRSRLAIALLALLATPLMADSVTRQNREVIPPVGTEAEVGTGDPILVSVNRLEIEFARLKADTRVSQSGMMLPKGLLLQGDLELGSGQKEYCKGYEAALYCLKDRDGDGAFDKVEIVGGGRPVEHLTARYDLVYEPATEGHGWRMELIYQGASAGVLRLTYREFSSDWTRPTAVQNLSYDISPSGETAVTYKSARLSFSSVTGNGARYTILADFRAPESVP